MTAQEDKDFFYYNVLTFYCKEGKDTELKEFIKNNPENLDYHLAYEEGYLGILAARNGHTGILEILFEHSAKIKDYKEGIFDTAARYGKQECVEFLIANGSDPKVLLNSTSYNNYPHIEKLFDKYLNQANKLSSHTLA